MSAGAKADLVIDTRVSSYSHRASSAHGRVRRHWPVRLPVDAASAPPANRACTWAARAGTLRREAHPAEESRCAVCLRCSPRCWFLRPQVPSRRPSCSGHRPLRRSAPARRPAIPSPTCRAAPLARSKGRWPMALSSRPMLTAVSPPGGRGEAVEVRNCRLGPPVACRTPCGASCGRRRRQRHLQRPCHNRLSSSTDVLNAWIFDRLRQADRR